MKKIILVRHGKSSWEHNVSDEERPLKSRGKSDAKRVATHYILNNSVPERIFSSSAKRALETCKIFINRFKLSENSEIIVSDLYDFGGENVISFIKKLPDNINEIMIFGHNHAFTSITNLYGDSSILNLPTAGLVKLKFEIDKWEELKQGTTELIIIPKELKE
ncbi:SixA phosphatase family protein [Winogradskyella sp. PE311]|uniref:SixA phosphatase family protein n=1 Tax=Winogradskyella sp. PE311 TaxID=3366943 RepID=UPI003980395C